MKNGTNYEFNSSLEKKRRKRRKKRNVTLAFISAGILLISFIGIKTFVNKRKASAKSNTTYTVAKKSVEQNKKQEESKTAKNVSASINNNDKKIVMTPDQIWNKQDNRKVAFLTFDDGPSKYTPQILGTLKKYNIKATFFLVGSFIKTYPQYVKQEAEAGHTIGNHTYNHKIRYSGVYTPQAFVQDVRMCENAIKSVLGQDFKTNLVRFPGGSFNHKSYQSALVNAGFKYIDWNVESGDARGTNIPKQELIDSVKKYSVGHNKVVLLMHDSATKRTTAEALPEIIEYLKSQGFEFGIVRQNN